MQMEFTKVPNWIIASKELSSNEKIAYIVLSKYCYGKKKECYPSIERMATECGIPRSTLLKNIKLLEEKDIIRRKKGYFGNTTHYYLS